LELLIIPLLFCVAISLAPANLSRILALGGGIGTLVVAWVHTLQFKADKVVSIFAPEWISSFGLTFKMGYDGMSLFMVLLTSLVIPLILLATFQLPYAKNKGFNAMVMLMQFGLLGVFMAQDGILFYVFWELTLIPVFLIAYWYGDEDKKPVLTKFFIYTFVGSLAMLLSFIALGLQASDFSYEQLVAVGLNPKVAFWVMGGFFLAFAIKIPLVPFHTWQPSTYTSAPTAGTMLLSALMLKMALYGMVKWMIPLAPEALPDFQCIVIVLGLIGIVYAAIIAIQEKDIKRLFAYASISHVGLIAAGIILFNKEILSAAYLQMANHSLVAVGLFLAASILEERFKTRKLEEMGGVAKLSPAFAFWFAVLCFASVSVPFTSGFIGEFLLLKGLYQYHWLVGLIAGTTLVFGAVYMLRAYQVSMFGHPAKASFEDLRWNELLVFIVLSVLIVTLGIFPQFVNDFVGPSLKNVMDSMQISQPILP
jgi:NADH-quinone oxidoreductase subunit M